MEYNYQDIGNRMRECRKKKGFSQDMLLAEIEAHGSNTTRNIISSLENGSKDKWELLQLGKLIAICGALDSDVGHIMGEYEASSNLVYEIAAYTGLSAKAVEVLHYATLPETARIVSDVAIENKRTVDFINRVLERVGTTGDKDGGRRTIKTVFAVMEDYVRSTGAWIEDRRTGERIEDFITVNYGDAPSCGFHTKQFLRFFLLEQIKKMLDVLQEEQARTDA